MAKPICPKCKSEDIKKGVMGASFGQVQMFPENIRGSLHLFQQSIAMNADIL